MHVKNKLIIHIIYINICNTIVMKNKAYTEHANPLPDPLKIHAKRGVLIPPLGFVLLWRVKLLRKKRFNPIF